MAAVSAATFWQGLYDRGEDGWDLHGPHPSLVHLVETTPPPRGRIAVPGCGRGHDAIFLARHGYEVVGFDFADTAVREARAAAAAAGVPAVFEQRDLFTLPGEHAGGFDGVWEHTCFCAIDPGRRDDYVDVVAGLMKPGGWYWACFFPMRTGDGGPPFPVDADDVRRRLAPRFHIERALAPPRPVERRNGQEWMVLAVRAGVPA